MKSQSFILQKKFSLRLATAIGLFAVFLVMLCLGSAQPASAWDSAFGSSSSHYRLLEDVIDSVALPAADLANETTYHDAMLAGSIYEATHAQRRSDRLGCSYGL